MIDTLLKVYSNPVVIFVTGWAIGIWTVIVTDYVARKRNRRRSHLRNGD